MIDEAELGAQEDKARQREQEQDEAELSDDVFLLFFPCPACIRLLLLGLVFGPIFGDFLKPEFAGGKGLVLEPLPRTEPRRRVVIFLHTLFGRRHLL